MPRAFLAPSIGRWEGGFLYSDGKNMLEIPSSAPAWRKAFGETGKNSPNFLFVSFFSLFFLFLLLTPQKSRATSFNDFIIYPYETPEQGEISLGTWQSVLLPSKSGEAAFNHSEYNQDILFSTYVLEFGVTDWWTLGTYVDFMSGAGQGYSYLQTRAITSRIRFPRIPDFIDPAIQIEYWVPTGAANNPSFLDLILIGEKKVGRFVFDINSSFFFETANPGGQPKEYRRIWSMPAAFIISWRTMSTLESRRSEPWGLLPPCFRLEDRLAQPISSKTIFSSPGISPSAIILTGTLVWEPD